MSTTVCSLSSHVVTGWRQRLLLGQNVSSDSVFSPLLHAIDGEAADVYSFGIVLYEISAQRLPWSDLKGAFILNSLLEKVTAGERPKMPEGTPEAFASLATECWATDPAARISFSEIVGRLQTQMKR